MINWWNEKSKKQKYFEGRMDNFKSEIWESKNLARNGDISTEESEKEIAKLQKRLDRNEKKYREYKDSDEYKIQFVR
tara:strand:- start:650 stop:880 length:231 start_codon:yes stop_codon:yes gene_type:complete